MTLEQTSYQQKGIPLCNAIPPTRKAHHTMVPLPAQLEIFLHELQRDPQAARMLLVAICIIGLVWCVRTLTAAYYKRTLSRVQIEVDNAHAAREQAIMQAKSDIMQNDAANKNFGKLLEMLAETNRGNAERTDTTNRLLSELVTGVRQSNENSKLAITNVRELNERFEKFAQMHDTNIGEVRMQVGKLPSTLHTQFEPLFILAKSLTDQLTEALRLLGNLRVNLVVTPPSHSPEPEIHVEEKP